MKFCVIFCMKRFWLILFVLPLFAQDINKHNISLGMLDDKTGLSLLGYTYNIRQSEMDEFFIGAGTIIIGFTGSAGWKHYYKKTKLSFYSVLSGQGFADISETTAFMPTASFGAELNLTKSTQLKFGFFGCIIFFKYWSGESGSEIGRFPFIGLGRKF